METSSEVTPGVHRIVMPLGARINSCYAFVGTRRILLFDTALDGDISRWVAPYLGSIGRDITEVSLAINSHGDVDHYGGNAELAELAPHALIGCHRSDLAMVNDPQLTFDTRYNELRAEGVPDSPEFGQWCLEHARAAPVDIALGGGEELRLDEDWSVRVLHVPGHSAGHLAIHDPRSGAVVLSDAVLGTHVPLADGSPAFPPTYRWAVDYIDTIAALTQMGPTAVMTAHYPTMGAEAGTTFLQASREFAELCDRLVFEHVAGAADPLTTREVIFGVAGKLGPWPIESVAAQWGQPILGHLEWLAERGKLIVTTEGIRRWSNPA